MITYKELRWGDAFSYGPTNVLRLDDNQLTQLVGKNGHGKSSIGLILEEVQFNTNSKKIKKAKVLNRYSKSKSYFIELDFSKDNDNYTISTTRTATTGSVRLLRNGVDISSHTSTGTYTNISNILGYDFTTFGQIVYQSSISSLEFLTATDTARKAFLIELLNLTHYSKASDVFKKLASDVNKQVSTVEGKLAATNTWLAKYSTESLELRDNVPEPDEPREEDSKLSALTTALLNISHTNKKINQNNTYIGILDGIIVDTVMPDKPSEPIYLNAKALIISLQNELKVHKACKVGASSCSACKQPIDNSQSERAYEQAQLSIAAISDKIAEATALVKEYEAKEAVYQASVKKLAEWEKYHSLVDKTLPTVLLDKKALEDEIEVLVKAIKLANDGILAARKINKAVDEHNAKVRVISEQIESMREELKLHSAEMLKLSNELANLQVLVKAFSTTGLVAYKIECLVKDLELLTNKYLADLADGRFQLSFKIASADKLNVVITDNGEDIEITALSTGEKARVNVATLLAIRALMQGLSNSRTNLLILDETVENLDAEGKEKLIEVLLKEDNLNTFLISHGFSHPLLEKLYVVKANNISRIEK